MNWKYTANARVCKKGEGWQKTGLERFNELCSNVMKDRNNDSGLSTLGFENWYLKYCQDKYNLKKRKRCDMLEPSVVTFNQLDEVDYSSDECGAVVFHGV